MVLKELGHSKGSLLTRAPSVYGDCDLYWKCLFTRLLADLLVVREWYVVPWDFP